MFCRGLQSFPSELKAVQELASLIRERDEPKLSKVTVHLRWFDHRQVIDQPDRRLS